VALRTAIAGLGACALGTASLVGAPSFAQEDDSDLQGRVFQSSAGVLWVYKDGVKYPLVGLDLSDDEIDAIPMVDEPIGNLADLFGSTAAPATVAGTAPTGWPVLTVSNPQPGDRLPAGNLHIQGTAYDTSASSGSGVDRVQVFLGPRERGGTYLADASLGRPSENSWDALVNLTSGVDKLFVYARSSATGREAEVSVPVEVGPLA
jgi:hypothetical protein